MFITIIDQSNTHKPSLDLRASEVISDSRGIMIRGASLDDPDFHSTIISIDSVARSIRQGFNPLVLSHDWSVAVREEV